MQRLYAPFSRNRDKVIEQFGNDLAYYTFTVLGLSFKPWTDDIREAPSPKDFFSKNNKNRNNITLFDNQYDALNQSDALVLMTECKSFRYYGAIKTSLFKEHPTI